jgi:hypothetical protein
MLLVLLPRYVLLSIANQQSSTMLLLPRYLLLHTMLLLPRYLLLSIANQQSSTMVEKLDQIQMVLCCYPATCYQVCVLCTRRLAPELSTVGGKGAQPCGNDTGEHCYSRTI